MWTLTDYVLCLTTIIVGFPFAVLLGMYLAACGLGSFSFWYGHKH